MITRTTKMIAVLLVAVLSLSLFATGCNNGGNKGGSAGQNSNGNISKKEYTIQAKGSEYAKDIMLPELTEKQAKISYMTNTDWDYIVRENAASPTPIYHAMMVWKETYGVDVEIELTDWDNFTNYLITGVTSGEGPDVFRYDRHPMWINNDLVASLDDVMDLSDPDYDMEYMKEREYDGHIHLIASKAANSPSNFVVYNKTKFRQAGEVDPLTLYKQGKWTFTQFAKTAKALSDPSNDEYGFTGYGLFPTAFPLVVLNKDRSLTSNLKSPEYLKWLTARINVIRDGAARPEDKGGSNYRTTFPTGKDAMYFSGPDDYKVILQAAKMNGTKDEFGIAPMPSNDMIGEQYPRGPYADGSTAGGHRVSYPFAMSSQCKNKEGAIEFLRLVTKIGTNIAESQGEYGTLTDVLTDEEKEVFKNIKYQDYTNITKGGLDSWTVFPDSLRNTYLLPLYISNNKTEVSAAINKMEGALNSAIKEYEISIGLRQ